MEHRVKSGWVRFLARGTRTGSVPDPGEQLPVIAPDEPYTNLTWRQQVPLPARDETMSFVSTERSSCRIARSCETYGAARQAVVADTCPLATGRRRLTG